MRETIITIDGVDYNEGIVSGSMMLDKLICDGDFRFGATCASKFEVQLYGIEDVTGKDIAVRQVINEKTQYLFYGRIESAKMAKSERYRDIVAYDMMYWLGNLDVSSIWNRIVTNLAGEAVQLGDFRRYVLREFGLSLITDNYEPIHDPIELDNLQILTSPLTLKSFLRMYGEASCGICYFVDFNTIKLGAAPPYMDPITGSLARLQSRYGDHEKLYRNESQFTEGSKGAYEMCIICDNLNNIIASHGSGDRVYIIQNNIIVNAMPKAGGVNMVAADTLSLLQGMERTWCDAECEMIVSGRHFDEDNNIVEDACIGVDKYITLKDKMTKVITECILSGVQLINETLRTSPFAETEGAGAGDDLANSATNIRFENIERFIDDNGLFVGDENDYTKIEPSRVELGTKTPALVGKVGETQFVMIRHNGSNLWIGASSSSANHTPGSVYISAGDNEETAYLNVKTGTSRTNYGIRHKGNDVTGTVTVASVAANSTANAAYISIPTALIGTDPVAIGVSNNSNAMVYVSAINTSGTNTRVRFGVKNLGSAALTDVTIHYRIS